MSLVDTGLLVMALKNQGHEVGPITAVPENAGDYEFVVDGETLTLTEVRALLENETK